MERRPQPHRQDLWQGSKWRVTEQGEASSWGNRDGEVGEIKAATLRRRKNYDASCCCRIKKGKKEGKRVGIRGEGGSQIYKSKYHQIVR
ncbi:hypothetical protein E2562_007490 [Oryza meyeriana var. granulata]|uniref:Uncharacterized protein n=1 Tax=Oryza meyeriana var. granulata TaxID=110450 RepID=A0A6G1DV85_9ORYZ|nr:hypothetical protein E2562_007490 [Oryza meyeriana var. granulata]